MKRVGMLFESFNKKKIDTCINKSIPNCGTKKMSF